MRTRLIVTLFMIGVASSASAQSGLFPQHQRPLERAPTGSRRSTLTETADRFTGDLVARTAEGDLVVPQMLQDGDGAAAIFPRTDVRGMQDVIGPGLNTKERALRGAALGAATELVQCSDAGHHYGCGCLVGAVVFGAAIGALEGALSDESELREWARELVRLRGRNRGSVIPVLPFGGMK